MADELQTLKHELEALKQQLQQERKMKNVVKDPQDGQQQSPNGNTTQAPRASPSEPRLFVQHAPVGCRRGKWWLRERRVLGRHEPTPGDNCAALRVRETWVWSGRSVVLDKIVRLVAQPTANEQDAEEAAGSEAPVKESVVEAAVVQPAPIVASTAAPAQPSGDAKTSEAASTTIEEVSSAVVDKVTEGLNQSPPKPTKAEDEVREGSAPAEQPLPAPDSSAVDIPAS